jgi:hypothetical protein
MKMVQIVTRKARRGWRKQVNKPPTLYTTPTRARRRSTSSPRSTLYTQSMGENMSITPTKRRKIRLHLSTHYSNSAIQTDDSAQIAEHQLLQCGPRRRSRCQKRRLCRPGSPKSSLHTAQHKPSPVPAPQLHWEEETASQAPAQKLPRVKSARDSIVPYGGTGPGLTGAFEFLCTCPLFVEVRDCVYHLLTY